jgi:SOS-response transcriptional repressor LexA
VLRAADGPLREAHPIPEKLPRTSTTTGQPQTVIEQRFKRFLSEAGLPAPLAQKRIDLGASYTVSDFFYAGEDTDDPGMCIYLDGMAGHIHGNPEQAEKDAFLREQLRARDYTVVVMRSFELDDRNAVITAIGRIAKYLVGKEKQRALREDTTWMDRAGEAPVRDRPGKLLRFELLLERRRDAIPVLDLLAAAGAFSTGAAPQEMQFVRIVGVEPRPAYFAARVVGDSMDRLVPSGALCLWEHLGTSGGGAPAPEQALLVRREGTVDPELGDFTFKVLREDATGRYLAPFSSNPAHRTIPLESEERIEALARFVAVLEPEGEG